MSLKARKDSWIIYEVSVEEFDVFVFVVNDLSLSQREDTAGNVWVAVATKHAAEEINHTHQKAGKSKMMRHEITDAEIKKMKVKEMGQMATEAFPY